MIVKAYYLCTWLKEVYNALKSSKTKLAHQISILSAPQETAPAIEAKGEVEAQELWTNKFCWLYSDLMYGW